MDSSLISFFLTLLNQNMHAKFLSKTSRTTSPQETMKLVPATKAQTLATMGSTIATFTFVWAIICQYCPYEIRHMIDKLKRRIKDYFYPYIRITIHEFTGHDRDRMMKRSEGYAAVEAYLSSNSSANANRLKAEKETDTSSLILSMDRDQILSDEFQGAKVWWVLKKFSSHRVAYEQKYYELTFNKRHREIITKCYLDHVIKEGKEIRMGNRQRKLYTNCSGGLKWSAYQPTMWSHIVFEHPASFEKMAMEAERKQEIIDDLFAFRNGKDYYASIGRAWKRGYLLYGPPGTGKSTMIAAMANLLGYDIYDLELTSVRDNTELRRLLIETTAKSIIVIEDIDCSLDLTGQRKKKTEKVSEAEQKEIKKEARDEGSKVTLSGLLNFIDGLWSSCGAERIVVFTTNYVEKLDPALIRRGRMDKYIELTYCSFEGFKVLAKNYLKLENHQMFDKIEKLMAETKITPADVAENLMPKSHRDDPEKCLTNLIRAMEEARERAEADRKKEEEEASSKANETKQPPTVKDIEENEYNKPV